MSRFRGGWGARPENALKRAEELENVGQKAAALQSLRDVITSKRSRANWSKTYEDIMFKLMELCVEMKRRNDAKEALMQYRNMCQQVNINSLEEVIKYYLNKATEKAEEARAQAEVSRGGKGDRGRGNARPAGEQITPPPPHSLLLSRCVQRGGGGKRRRVMQSCRQCSLMLLNPVFLSVYLVAGTMARRQPRAALARSHDALNQTQPPNPSPPRPPPWTPSRTWTRTPSPRT
jgi:hypothetical protein